MTSVMKMMTIEEVEKEDVPISFNYPKYLSLANQRRQRKRKE
jgi:hypothetical protein